MPVSTVVEVTVRTRTRRGAEDVDMTQDDAGSAPMLGSQEPAGAISDEELDAIANGASSLEAEAMREGLSLDAKAFMRQHAATLRGLLARLA